MYMCIVHVHVLDTLYSLYQLPVFVLQTDLAGIASWLTSPRPLSVPKTLIFTQNKNIACKLYVWLSQCAATKTCVNMYHASLTHTTKAHIQEEFSSAHASLRCLVSTVAFGMVLFSFAI